MKSLQISLLIPIVTSMLLLSCQSAGTRPEGALKGEIRTVRLTLLGAD